MTDAERLIAEFEAGRLIRPSVDDLNIVDLANAMASLAGIDSISLTPGADVIAQLIGPADHLVFVVADGLAMGLVEALGSDAFMRQHVATTLHTVFPSTTASAFTSLATGQWPNRHAALGWHTYVPEVDAVTTIIPFVRSVDNVPLTDLGLKVEQAFPVPSLAAHLARDSLSLVPQPLANSTFSKYISGGSARAGYGVLLQALDTIAERIRVASQPTYTYLYVPDVDVAGHEFGYSDPRTLTTAVALDRCLQGLAETLSGHARIVLTADHGGLDAAPGQIHRLEASDPLVKCLKHEPSGDNRAAYFDVPEGEEREFETLFRDRFGDRFFVISVDDSEALEFFGPGPLSEATRSRLGTFAAISAGADVLLYAWPSRDPNRPIPIGHHSGLSPSEMRIPLIIA
ncbi:MAG: alkaline phosphatase family protein [Chloroflexi bacterium]|nr:alkaline phosphatase family protein [Chloroflexota bacterium]